MKVKFDFVTNSSSTSFVYISDEEFSEEVFFEAVGVDRDGPVGDLFHQMYSEISNAIRHHGEQVRTIKDADDLTGRHEFTPDVIKRMKVAIEQGKSVITSKLSSDGPFAESLMCTAIFEIESDHFYINAYDNIW